MKHEYEDFDLGPDPLKNFESWLAQARLKESNSDAFVLATCSQKAVPSARVVLLKSWDSQGLIFYTHGDSPKGLDLQNNPLFEAVFWWPVIERQIRIKGKAEKLATRETHAYWQKRDRRSQLISLASNQSHPLKNRAELSNQVQKLEQEFDRQEIPLPPEWTGIRLCPQSFEFFLYGQNRMNDRFIFSGHQNKTWTIARLSP